MSYRAKVLHELRTRCIHLKTKSAYLGLPDEEDVENDVPTAIWWCELTAEPLGPDGEPADPKVCGASGRPCHRLPRRPQA